MFTSVEARQAKSGMLVVRPPVVLWCYLAPPPPPPSLSLSQNKLMIELYLAVFVRVLYQGLPDFVVLSLTDIVEPEI